MDSNLEMFTEAKEPIYWSTWHSNSPYRNLGKYTSTQKDIYKAVHCKTFSIHNRQKKKKERKSLNVYKKKKEKV